MIAVINAGGSGSRLWPLSTPEYPKHLLKMKGDESLLQSAVARAKTLAPLDKLYVITEAGHAEHVKRQLPELPDDAFIIEPARRGTAGCMVAGLEYLQSRHDNNEPIAFLHADHAIRDIEGFQRSFEAAAKATTDHKRLTLIGIEPTYPATGFGYIERDGAVDDHQFVHQVVAFKEKPEFDMAKSYVASGRYLWNCGYFVASIATFVAAFREFSPEWHDNYQRLLAATTPEAYQQAYLSFENMAIDYALLERTTNLLVVPATFDWVDLGSFKDAHSASERDQRNNFVKGLVETEEVENAYIRNEEDKPVAVIGLDNVVVVNTPNGVLVARKDMSQKVGDVSKRFNS
ncbi:MAG TPA: sugar phosphate nucleotidyltransferase [Verrucomicrobiae bacterium]|nr:sugar phosphate nucleotidyltransferase [Verrucomicrobiae bacterium]